MRKRPLALLVLTALAVPPVVFLPVVSAPAATPHPVAPAFQYVPLGTAGVDRAAAQALGLATAAAASATGTGRLAVLTPEETVRPYRLVGLTWDAAPDPTSIQVRTRANGVWSAWNTLGVTDARPDAGTPEAAHVKRSAEPLIAPDSDGVQVKVETASGLAPAGLRVALVNPGTSAADGEQQAAPASSASAAASMPTIVTRAQWGADESLRDSAFKYTSTVKVAFVHHTASGNSYFASGYSMAGAERDIRSIYAYSVGSAGYADLPYNFLVDYGGSIYEGRAGGMDKAVLSAATGGFNTNTMAVAALGNFSTAHPSSALVSGIEKVLAWKLGLFHVDPTGTTVLTASGGSGTTSRYTDGTAVRVNDISGHRDVGQTACPGGYLYPFLPTIRSTVRVLQQAAFYDPAVSSTIVPPTSAATVTARVPYGMGYLLQAFDSTGKAVRSIHGSVAAGATLSAVWDLKNDAGHKVPEGAYTLSLTGSGTLGSAVPYSVSILVGTPDVPTTIPLAPLYYTPGSSTSSGRQWRTTCTYPSLKQLTCNVQILSSYYARDGNSYVNVHGWVTNDLTYIAWDSPQWSTGVIAVPGQVTFAGRQYKTTCSPSVSTGTRLCYSYILSSVVVKVVSGGRTTWKVQPAWHLNTLTYLGTKPTGP